MSKEKELIRKIFLLLEDYYKKESILNIQDKKLITIERKKNYNRNHYLDNKEMVNARSNYRYRLASLERINSKLKEINDEKELDTEVLKKKAILEKIKESEKLISLIENKDK